MKYCLQLNNVLTTCVADVTDFLVMNDSFLLPPLLDIGIPSGSRLAGSWLPALRLLLSYQSCSDVQHSGSQFPNLAAPFPESAPSATKQQESNITPRPLPVGLLLPPDTGFMDPEDIHPQQELLLPVSSFSVKPKPVGPMAPFPQSEHRHASVIGEIAIPSLQQLEQIHRYRTSRSRSAAWLDLWIRFQV